MVEMDRAMLGSGELRRFDTVARRLNSGWHHYGRIKDFAGGSATTGGPVPTAVEEDRRAPVITGEWREAVERAFVRPDEFPMAKAVLVNRHVVVLQGLARCGKTWMAAQLLRSVGIVQPCCVYAIADLPEPLEEQAGYVVDDLGARDADGLDVRAVRLLEDRARAAKSYVVITVDDEVTVTRPTAALLVACTGTPAAEQVLARGLDAHYIDGRPDGLADLLQTTWVQSFLRTQPLPGAVAQLVDTLIVKRGRPEAARTRFEQARAQEVAQWFKRYPTLRDRCFMVAAAVFQDSTLDRVDQAARLLEDAFGGRGAPGERAGVTWRLLSPRRRRLRAIGANLVEEQERTPEGEAPTLLVRFEPSWLPGAVLRHVWEEHEDARQVVSEWLKQRAVEDTGDGIIHFQAAAALGVLGREDTGWLNRAVQQWVSARTDIARDAAGVALAALGREPTFADQLMPGLRRRVAEDPSSARSAVAAVVYGLLPQEAHAVQALEDLRAILASGPRRIPAVTRSMAMLCESDVSTAALDALCEWTRNRVPGALRVLLRLMTWHALSDEHDDPPLLLWIARSDETNAQRVIELWCRAWERGVRRDLLRQSLGMWLRHVDGHEVGRTTMDAVVEELAAKGARWRLLLWFEEWAQGNRPPRDIAVQYRSRLSGGNRAVLSALRTALATQRATDSARQRLSSLGGG